MPLQKYDTDDILIDYKRGLLKIWLLRAVTLCIGASSVFAFWLVG